MSDSASPQFFAPDALGNSQPIYKAILENLETLESSQIKARNRQFKNNLPSSSMVIDGMPGIPFERTTPNPDVFYQGEDIVYDLLLINDGKKVVVDEYDIVVAVKTSPRATKMSYEAVLDNGLFAVANSPGYYELWIPSVITSGLLAGTYYLNVMLVEKVGAGAGKYDRKYIALQTYFNLEYSNYSPNPERRNQSLGGLTRSDAEQVWPNTPDTVGKMPIINDYYTGD